MVCDGSRKTKVTNRWLDWEREARNAKLEENRIKDAVMQYRSTTREESRGLVNRIRNAHSQAALSTAQRNYNTFLDRLKEGAIELQRDVYTAFTKRY